MLAGVLSRPVKCQLLPFLTIRFVRFGSLMTFNRLETILSNHVIPCPGEENPRSSKCRTQIQDSAVDVAIEQTQINSASHTFVILTSMLNSMTFALGFGIYAATGVTAGGWHLLSFPAPVG
jgi:hypothetical protein